MTCSNEISHMWTNKKIELVIPSELIFIKLSNSAKIMELAHAQPKLFATDHARGRKLQTEKIAFEVRGHASTWSSALSFLIQLFGIYFTLWCILNPLPSRAYSWRYALQVVYYGYHNIIRVFSSVSLPRSDQFYLFMASECALRMRSQL